ncbi:MAG: hypothetical protein V4787_11490 [Pseudomonadota bacterium]
MRYWIQYMQRAVPGPWNNHTSPLIDACGDSAVFILDGRNNQETMHRDALRRAQRMEHWKQYDAYKLCAGTRLFYPSLESQPRALSYPIRTA